MLLTVDADFDHVLERLGQRHKNRVVTIEPGKPCAKSFPARSEMTIPLAKLKAAFQYRRKERAWKRTSNFVLPRWNRANDFRRSVLSRIHERYSLLRRRVVDRQTLEVAADHIATLAHQKPGLQVGRRTVMRY